VTTAGTARGRDTPIKIRFVPHAGRGGRRHGQTHFAFGAKLGRGGMTAGLQFRSRHDATRQRRGLLVANQNVTFLGLTLSLSPSL